MIRAALVACAVWGGSMCLAGEPLVVHEWGTFTALQDEKGNALGRINTDDEPVPGFVQQMVGTTMFPPTAAFTEAKGIPAGNPAVTMRLETPVLYFHLPKNYAGPMKADVDVNFHGGWLTQYFPDAKAGITGANPTGELPLLTAESEGSLAWHGIALNSGEGKMPETSDHVWTSPRAVEAATVSVGGDREKFLFYRGVAHLDSPVRVVRSDETLEIQAAKGVKIGESWLVDIKADGSLAFRAVAHVENGATTAAEFAAGDYKAGNLLALRGALHEALVAEGLFGDEADALLNTWERSYFQNPGERLFFMVPQAWTDGVMPLKISTEAKVTRVMVGRVELVTPAQRELLAKMAKAPMVYKEIDAAAKAMTKLQANPQKAEAYAALAGGHGKVEELGVAVPELYADYLALGRFRTALVLDSNEMRLQNMAAFLVP